MVHSNGERGGGVTIFSRSFEGKTQELGCRAGQILPITLPVLLKNHYYTGLPS